MDLMIQAVYQSVMDGNEAAVAAACEALLAAGVSANQIVRQGMIPCMDQLGTLLVRQEKFIPHIMMSTRAMQTGLRILAPYLGAGGIPPAREAIIIGTVRGDIHSIGKTLVSILLQSCGFQVIDLGTNVQPDGFVAAVQEHHARIIAISAMLTTTMPSMKATVKALQKVDSREPLHILVGGAPVNERFALELDVEYVADAVETTNRVLCICGRPPLSTE